MIQPELHIEKVVSTHSFDKYQVSVVRIAKGNEDPLKGIALSPLPLGYFEESINIEVGLAIGKPIPLDIHHVHNICQYIENVIAKRLPNEIDIGTNKFYIRLKLKKFIEKWHEGGGYKGVMGYPNNHFLGLLPRVTISKGTLLEFRKNLIGLYEIERPDLQ